MPTLVNLIGQIPPDQHIAGVTVEVCFDTRTGQDAIAPNSLLRVYETLSDPTGRKVCGYLLVRRSVHAHAYALALKTLTGVAIVKMLPVPNIPLGNIPEWQKYLDEGTHRRLYT